MYDNSGQWHLMMSRSWSPRDWFDEGQRPELDDHRGGIMFVFRPNGDKWETGYYTPDRIWVADQIWDTKEEATNRVHWLNGGD